ncbi:hypothetical protein P691DRAFT_779207 [Macrolepiota fuliginosa MF-IS2]|uniref:Kri1-like C-terminal domain-containing protein n=1 Tax=Macrolepiota fuliginosa MF-IS2 TaxID=1400762 RepID=A0A9P5X381_9AGAR|nr:hypothetical protein P691DRAFT_779207 [Macrolepiota fuliginosa MF-IS2]
MLSDSDDDPQNEELHKITVNEHYAKAFQYRKEREELDRLKEKLGSDISEADLEEDESDSESDVSEDEDGEELTATVDAAILRTLARIRRKDPSIYESSKGVFEEEQEKLASKAAFTVPGKTKKKDKDSPKPVTLRQAALEAQLNSSRSPSPEPLTHVQEQQELQKETISAFHAATGGGVVDDDDDLLVPREKTKDEQEQEEEEYRAYLEREVGDLRDIIGDNDVKVKAKDEPVDHDSEEGGKKKRKKKKKSGKEEDGVTTLKNQKSKEEDQEFLMNYILNRGWIDKSKDRVPTYHEVTKSKSNPKKSKPKATIDSDSDSDPHPSNHAEDKHVSDKGDDTDSDASFESFADAFESSYNFRFEEPNSSTIPSFPRSIPSLVRREDTKRKDARERRKQRKEEEMEKRREEVRRLKALKMREIRRKLELVGRQGGILGAKGKGKTKEALGVDEWEAKDGEMDEALRELDLEGDWDPEKHDVQMAGLFAGGEGDVEEGWDNTDEVDEDGKPVWNDDIDIGDIHISDDDAVPVDNTKKDKKKKKKKKKKGGEEEQEDEGVDIDAMDADVQALRKELGEEEEWDGTEEMRKRKLDEYMEEVYNLDFNDMVGDLPTRFKYTPVAPQTYSLTPVEILLATDKELNEFMSVKRYAPYKTDARKWDAKRQQKLKELKGALAGRSKTGGWLVKDSANGAGGASGSGSRAGNAQGEGEQKAKKRKGKKERMKAKAAAAEGEDEGERERDDETENTVQVDDGSRLNGASGVDAVNRKPKKDKLEKMATERDTLKGKGHKRKSDKIEGAEAEVQEPQELEQSDENGKPKKKRRRKHNKKSGGDGGGGD